MNIQKIEQDGVTVAVIDSNDCLIASVQDALDLMMTVKYETECDKIAINKEALADDFFILSTKLAGEVLQKFVIYHVKIAIYGDFSGYTSKPLKDFIYESNKGRDVFFQPDKESAVAKLVDSAEK